MRITIIGNCGSGKSTLAREISKKLGIPHLHLDRLWFEGGGNKVKKDDVEKMDRVRAYIRERVEKFIQQDSWISDGWYKRVQPLITAKADRIIFLDIPLWRRLLNHLRRVFGGERHPELSKWDDFKFVFEIIHRTFTHGVDMRKFVYENSKKVLILHSHKEVDRYLAGLNYNGTKL